MDGKISRQTPFLTDNIHNREMYISVEIILSGLPFQSTENISYGYEDSELNGVAKQVIIIFDFSFFLVLGASTHFCTSAQQELQQPKYLFLIGYVSWLN